MAIETMVMDDVVVEMNTRSMLDELITYRRIRYNYLATMPELPEVVEPPAKSEVDEAFDRVIKRLESMKDEDFDMSAWCACIAGATCMEYGYKFKIDSRTYRMIDNYGNTSYAHPCEVAARILGFRADRDIARVFTYSGWPTIDNQPMFDNSRTGAIERLRYYQETGL